MGDMADISPQQRFRLIDSARRIAADGDDPTMRAHIAINASSILADTGDFAKTAELLEHSLASVEGVSTIELANMHAVCGRHYGNARNREQAARHAETAEDLYGASNFDDIPEWSRPMLGDCGHVLGRTWLVDGQPRRAVETLTAARDAYAPIRTRAHIRTLCRRALAHTQLGDYPSACADTASARKTAASLSSVRIDAELASLRSRLEPAPKLSI